MKEVNKSISGFSKLSKRNKIKWLVENFFIDPEAVMKELISYWHQSKDQQEILDNISENTISNFPMPYGVAPNFQINGELYCIPMVIEESSVVAAASNAAKFWLDRGGFKTNVIDSQKIGQVHFLWTGDYQILKSEFPELKRQLIDGTNHITQNMQSRGGGVLDVQLINNTHRKKNYYQLKASFETCDSMGANFINSVLEEFANILSSFIQKNTKFHEKNREVEIIMSILSNYTPDSIARAEVSCSIDELGIIEGLSPLDFAQKFKQAIEIAHIDPHRAATHNKGIFNGVDAVVLATGNDFRAVEACGHVYASKDGTYRSLSNCSIDNGIFKFWLELPLAIGTVGGLTNIHPFAKRSMELLNNPSGHQLMQIVVSTGLAQNFAAIRSLITTGIQKGHMKMHLINILNQLHATETQKKLAVDHFSDKIVSFSSVRSFIDKK